MCMTRRRVNPSKVKSASALTAARYGETPPALGGHGVARRMGSVQPAGEMALWTAGLPRLLGR